MNLKALALLLIIVVSGKILAQTTLPIPVVTNGISCGAGNLVLIAESSINDPSLIFDWYQEIEGELLLLGSIDGPDGFSQFITPYVIQDEIFQVGIRLNDQESALTPVSALVENVATIQEAPRIELCESVTLNSSNTFDPLEASDYQWQKLTAQENGEAVFQDMQGYLENSALLTEIGFYRVVVTRNDGCQAISSEVEVTDDRFLFSEPLGVGEHCFTDNEFTHTVELSSEYGREITTYVWEESSNGVDFSEISTEQTVLITKDPAIVSTTSVFYRLTVIEENCFEVSDIVSIDWILGPSGTIAHSDPGIGQNDFFYCDSDDASTRTLAVEDTGPFDVSVFWIRGILLPGISLDFIKGPLRTLNPLDPAHSNIFDEFELIGTGPMITLEEEDGGLIYAIFQDNVTGCESFSDNAIFADTAFPYPLSEGGVVANENMNIVCQGEGMITFNSYDQSVDEYSWQKRTLGSTEFVEIGSDASLLLDATIESVAGTYQLNVTKNGCVGQSHVFSVVESTPPEAEIVGTNGAETSLDEFTICPGEEIFLGTVNLSNAYSYRWLSGEGTVLGNEEFLGVSEGGTYLLEVTNGACVDLSDPFLVIANPVPSTALNVTEDPSSPICEPFKVELTSWNDGDTYQWFTSENNLDFVPIQDDDDTDHFISEPGFFYVEVTNSLGCSARSDTINVPAIVIAEINVADTKICGSSDHALLIAESPRESNTYTWLYSPDNIQPYVETGGTNFLTYYEAFEEGYYILQVANDVCSAVSEPTVVIQQDAGINEDFDILIEGASSACLGSSISLSCTYLEDGAEYFWLYSADGVDYLPLSGGASRVMKFNTDRFASQNADETLAYFKVGVTDAPCSALSDPFALTIVRSPIVEIRNSIHNEPSDLFYCTEEELGFALEAFQVSTNLKLNYQWSRLNPESDSFEVIENEQGKKYEPEGPGRYRCMVETQGQECLVFSNEIDVITLPKAIAGESTFCLGQEIYMEIDQGFIPASALDFFTFQWFYTSPEGDTPVPIDGETGASLSVNPESPFYGSGSFHFEASISACTQVSEPFEVKESENSFTLDVVGNPNQFRGIPFELEAFPTDLQVSLFSWEPKDLMVNSATKRVAVLIPEKHEGNELEITVFATSINGCSASQSMVVFLSDVPSAVFSKLITPNGDGLNDFFTITGLKGNMHSDLKILNNWGNVIYETEDYNNDPIKSAELIEKLNRGIYYYLFGAEGHVTKGSFYVKK